MPAAQTLRAPRGAAGKATSAAGAAAPDNKGEPRPEAEILFQKYFKSAGSRTYASQMKRTARGDHFLVLTEGRRDPKTEEVRKSRLLVFSEDFPAFFRMLHETAQFIKANPVPDEVRRRQAKFRARQPQPQSGKD